MDRRPFFPLLLLIPLGLLASCNTRQAAIDDYVQGQIALDNGNTAAAMIALTRAIEENPRMGSAWLARGMLMKQKGDYQKSAADLEQAAALQPQDFDSNFQLGTVYQLLKRFREAVKAYQKAVEVRPLNPDVNMNLAVVYTQLGEPLRALDYAKRAVDGDPTSPFTQANLGILYVQLGRSDDAIISLRRSIDQNSKQPEVYVALANEYLRLSTVPNPAQPPQVYYTLAKNVLSAAMARIPAHPGLHERLGLVWYKLNFLDKAIASYNAALDLDKNYVPALNGLGAMHMTRALQSTPPDRDQAHQALAAWRQSLQLTPDQPAIKGLVRQYQTLE